MSLRAGGGGGAGRGLHASLPRGWPRSWPPIGPPSVPPRSLGVWARPLPLWSVACSARRKRRSPTSAAQRQCLSRTHLPRPLQLPLPRLRRRLRVRNLRRHHLAPMTSRRRAALLPPPREHWPRVRRAASATWSLEAAVSWLRRRRPMTGLQAARLPRAGIRLPPMALRCLPISLANHAQLATFCPALSSLARASGQPPRSHRWRLLTRHNRCRRTAAPRVPRL